MRRLLPVALLLVLWVPAAGAWTWPVSGPVLQGFTFDPAHPYAGGQHRGVDVGADAAGLPVVAPASGVVSFAGTVPSSGKSVTIDTPDGLAVTLTHLGSLSVAKGNAVTEGAVVGTVGPSGTPEVAGPYLHLGIRTAADPEGYLDPLGFLPVVAPPVAAPTPAPAPEAPPAVAPPVSADPPAAAPPVEPAPPAPAPDPAPAAAPIDAAPTVEPPAVQPEPAAPPAVAPAAESAPAVEPPAAEPAPAAPPATPVEPAQPAPPPAAAIEPVQPATPAAPPAVQDAPALVEPSVEPAAAPSVPQTAPVAVTAAPPLATDAPSFVARVPSPAAGTAAPAAPTAPPAATRPTASGRHAPAPARPHAAPSAVPVTRHRPRPAVVARRRSHPHVPALLLGLLALAGAAALGAARMISSRSSSLEGTNADAFSAEGPRRRRLAVRERSAASGPCRRPRRALRHLRALPPAEGQRRADGERHGRARDAGDGGRGSRRRLAA